VTNLTPQEILSLPLGEGSKTDAKTVGEYLMFVATQRLQHLAPSYPFGVQNWRDPLIWAFADAKLIWLRTDEKGLIDDYSSASFDRVLDHVFDFLSKADFSTIQPSPEPKEWYLVCMDTSAPRNPEIEDHDYEPYTEKDAKTKAEDLNKELHSSRWVAIHIPSVS
jgi:hypothetical protein